MRQAVVLVAVVVGFGCGSKMEKSKEYTTQELITTLKDPDPNMRYWAARELGKSPGTDASVAVQALTEALADPDTTVRSGAAYALGDIGPQAKSALPALNKARQGSSNDVRDGVEYAIKAITGKAGK
jgi:HEAT repeat protein